MSWISAAWDIALGVLGQVTRPESSIYWVYLSSAFLLALGVYLFESRSGRSLRGALAFCFPREVYGHRSVRHDAVVFAANAIFYSFVLVGPVTGASTFASQKTWALLHQGLGPVANPHAGLGVRVAVTLAVLAVADLAFFLSHIAQHKIPALWEFHKVHHSAPVLVPLTVFRRHPVDVLIERGRTGVFAGVVLGVSAYLTGGGVDGVTVLGVNAGLFLFLVLGFNLQHSHVWLSWGSRLERLFVSPALHQVHHSTDPRHLDKNFGNVFSLWDWLFGTLYLPREKEALRFGLAGEDPGELDGALKLYYVPFLRLALRYLPRRRRSTPGVR